MWVIRLVITVLYLVLVLLFGVLVHVVTWVIGKFDEKACLRLRCAFVRRGLGVLWLIAGGKTTVIGRENIPTDRAVLLTPNHRSLLDSVLCLALVPVPMGVIAKIELEKIPLLRMQMRDIHCLFLDRKDNRQGLKVILQAIEYVKGGQSMMVFPEGTRSRKEGELLPFHAGSFKVATKAKAPVVPVTIVGMGDVLDDHFPKLKRAPVVIEFGTPIETASMSRQEIQALPDRVRDIISETYARNRDQVIKTRKPSQGAAV